MLTHAVKQMTWTRQLLDEIGLEQRDPTPICFDNLSAITITYNVTYHAQTSVGEVRSGPVPGHFCRTGDRTVWSLTKFLGLGLGTATDRLYRSGPGPDRVQMVPALFIYLFIQD